MKAPFDSSTLLLILSAGLICISSYGQGVDSTVSLALSIPHGDQLKTLNDCSSFNNDVFIVINNNTDSTVRFYENWNSYGYYNFTFEIKTNDTIYTVSRPYKLWYRNFPSHHSVLPQESIVFQFDLIDSTCAANRSNRGIFEDGWIGLPNQTDTALIRVIYSLPSEFTSYPDLTSRKDDYLGYLDLEYLAAKNMSELREIKPTTKREENNSRIFLFSQPLMSEWRKIIISH